MIITDKSGSNLYTGILGYTGTPGQPAFNGDVWVDTALPLASVSYTVGDFNGDGKSDVIIEAATGSFECLGQATGGISCPSSGTLSSSAWDRPDLPLGSVVYTAGDFNGDGASDLLITGAHGMFEYTGLKSASGGFNTNNVWVDTSLTWPSPLTLVPGDFNGDGATDLIVMTTAGSQEYLGKKSGGFNNTNTWSRGDLNFSEGVPTAQYFPGDFDGDHNDDLIILTNSGAYWYTGKSGGGFTPNPWVDKSLHINAAWFWPSDFDGDGATDVIVAWPTGSAELMGGLPQDPFSPNVWLHPDLNLFTMQCF